MQNSADADAVELAKYQVIVKTQILTNPCAPIASQS